MRALNFPRSLIRLDDDLEEAELGSVGRVSLGKAGCGYVGGILWAQTDARPLIKLSAGNTKDCCVAPRAFQGASCIGGASRLYVRLRGAAHSYPCPPTRRQ